MNPRKKRSASRILLVKKILKGFSTLTGWKEFVKILSRKEKIVFFVLLFSFSSSSIFLSANSYLDNTIEVPSYKGTYTEGIKGYPRFINPVYSAAHDVDRDLTELIYSGLFKYTLEKIVPDIAERYEILEQGKIYEVYLKENVLWHDGQKLTADDVIFTIKTIQDPEYKSPIRSSWLGVDIEKISDFGVRFKLKNSYAPFIENLTLKILPKHIWSEISVQNFALSTYNLKPIGSGPFEIKSMTQDKKNNVKNLTLIRNEKYFNKKPYLEKISFYFFSTEDDLISAFTQSKIKGFAPSSLENLPKSFLNLNSYSFYLPRYFSIFLNPAKFATMERNLLTTDIRKALNYATDKEEIIQKILLGKGVIVDSPILPEIYGFNAPEKIYEYNLEKARNILDEAGFEEKEGKRIKTVETFSSFKFETTLNVGSKNLEVEELQKCLSKYPDIYPDGEASGYFGNQTKQAVIKFQEKYKEEILSPYGLEEGTGKVGKTTKTKLNEICFPASEENFVLKFTLSTVKDSYLSKVALLIKDQWQKIGVELEIKLFDIFSLEKDVIKSRDYEMLLFGEALTMIPNPYPFWHSSLKVDPGLNLAHYKNKASDSLLEEARKTLDPNERKEKLEEFQKLLIEDAPVVFLYNPEYTYFLPKQIKGVEQGIIIDPSKRFSGIENWYMETKRVLK